MFCYVADHLLIVPQTYRAFTAAIRSTLTIPPDHVFDASYPTEMMVVKISGAADYDSFKVVSVSRRVHIQITTGRWLEEEDCGTHTEYTCTLCGKYRSEVKKNMTRHLGLVYGMGEELQTSQADSRMPERVLNAAYK